MNSRQIECALELARTLNFGRAASNLGITQPSLSYQIKALEDEVGFRMFDRDERRTSLTPAGESLCDSLRIIRLEIQEAVERAQNISRGYSEAINLCLPLYSAMPFMSLVVERFDSEVQGVRLNVSYLYTDSMVELLRRGTYDAVFVREGEVAHLKDVRFEGIYPSSIYAFVRSDDPLASRESIVPSDLDGRTLIVGKGSPPELRAVQSMFVSKADVSLINSTDPDSARVYVESHRGVVLGPGYADERRQGIVRIPVEDVEPIQCGLAFRSDDERCAYDRLVSIMRSVCTLAGPAVL